MKVAGLFMLFAAGATAFMTPAPRTMGRTKGVATMAISKAIPFLQAPEKLDGSLVGDYGFDPIGISDQLADLKYVRASELKHGRVAMLAFLGYIVAQFVHLPGEIYAESNPLKALSTVPLLSQMQIFGFIAAIEMMTLDQTYTSPEPWNLGFDPLNFSKGKSAEEIKTLELKEIKNGRLAMVAMIGLFVQTLMFDKPFLP